MLSLLAIIKENYLMFSNRFERKKGELEEDTFPVAGGTFLIYPFYILYSFSFIPLIKYGNILYIKVKSYK